VADCRVPLENEEDLHEQRPITERPELLADAPKPAALPGRRHQHGHLIRISRLARVRHGSNT
jgi:hypothetical protein